MSRQEGLKGVLRVESQINCSSEKGDNINNNNNNNTKKDYKWKSTMGASEVTAQELLSWRTFSKWDEVSQQTAV